MKAEDIKNLLREAKIFFNESENFIHTMWKDKNKNEISIIIFIQNDWLLVSSIIDKNKIRPLDNSLDYHLLKLNLKHLGLKFAIDNKDRYLLLYQINESNITVEKLKEIFPLFLKIINELYYG